MTYQRRRIGKLRNCGDRGAIGANAMRRLNQSISQLPVPISGISLRTWRKPVSVVNSHTDRFSREPGMTKAATGLRRTLGYGALLFFIVAMSGNASAQAGDAERILKAMSDYLTSQKVMMFSFDADVEVIARSPKTSSRELG
jgi:hypothetical protein